MIVQIKRLKFTSSRKADMKGTSSLKKIRIFCIFINKVKNPNLE
jgi:hypothetical protein